MNCKIKLLKLFLIIDVHTCGILHMRKNTIKFENLAWNLISLI